jgi:CIC family chloride channel protein
MSQSPVQKDLRYVDRRVILISLFSIAIAVVATGIAQILVKLIGFVTNLAYYGRLSTDFSSPSANHLGIWGILIPVVGGILVGFMAKYGSRAICGHGIPEAMEQILTNDSKIPFKVMILKPISAAISIGTGGPFGAEGPIIATGGALGSVIGQRISITHHERKVLLAAGASAGMTAIFGTPVAAVLLSIELLLFEFKPRSWIPVALAAIVAAGIRLAISGPAPVFAMPEISSLPSSAIFWSLILGVLAGLASVFVTRVIYWIEDGFEHVLDKYWMAWPALGGIVVGVIGYFFPKTLGVGYDNIDAILSGNLAGKALILFFVMKWISWSISLGSGTSGGTLAPLLMIGGGLGAALGSVFGMDTRLAALVGMAALFAGSSRALFASVIFAFEATRQSLTLLPIFAGCTSSYLVSALLMKNSIMTEKIARRGVHVPVEYGAVEID